MPYGPLPRSQPFYPCGLLVQRGSAIAGEEYGGVVDLELKTINGRPTEEVLAMLRDVISHENEAAFKSLAVGCLVIPSIMQGLGIVDGDVCAMGFAGEAGEKVVLFEPMEVDKIKYVSGSTKLPLYRRHGDLYYWYSIPTTERCTSNTTSAGTWIGPFGSFARKCSLSLPTTPWIG